MSNAELTAAVLDLGKMVAGIQSYLVSLGMQPTASVSVHQPWMSPSPLPIPSYAMASTLGLVYTTASTPTVAPVPTTGAVVVSGVPSLQHPFTDGIIYRGAGVQQIQDEGEKPQQIEQPMDKLLSCQVSAVVRLQAAVRGLLARRRVWEMHDLQLIQPDTPSHLLQVGLRHMDEFNPVCCAKDLLHSVPPMGGGQAVFSAGGELNLCDGGGLEGTPLPVYLVIGGSALPSVIVFRRRPPQGCLHWSLLRPILDGRPCASLLSRWHPWDPGGHTRTCSSRGGCPTYLQES